MSTYQLYIGSSNTTGRLEIERIREVVAANHDGFTIFSARGYWQGKPESSAVVIVNDKPYKIQKTIQKLKSELKQDAIGYQLVPDIEFA